MAKAVFSLLLFTTALIYNAVESQFARCSAGESCIPFKDCDPLVRLTQSGRLTPQQTAMLRSKQCNSINRVAYVCCEGNIQKANIPRPPTCGTLFGDRIFGGEETSLDDFPWIAQIWYTKPGGKLGSHCGGSLINEQFVITAAHCDRKVPPTWKINKVRLGEWDTRSNPDCVDFVNERVCADPFVEVPVSKVIVHQSYDAESRNQPNDIALLKLDRKVTFTEWIKPICLPVDFSVRNLDFTSHALEVAGFGKTENENSSPIKLKVALNATPQGDCQAFYSRQGVQIGSSQMCAGGEEGRDSCNGDSGGPLMKYGTYPNSQTSYYMLVGIVSFGPKNCGTKDIPGVYTRVSEYIDWISSNAV